MRVLWGWVLIVFAGLLCWGGQVLNALAPAQAERLGISEPEADVDAAYYADGHGEALWDAVSLWVLPLAGVLLILGLDAWIVPGLVGGGMYIYFAGRGLVARRVMQQTGIVIGKPATARLFDAFLALWGLSGLITVIMACLELTSL